jgi:hypothetical protein
MSETQREQHDVIDDLMSKAGDDVSRAIRRTLSICPKPHLPVALAAAAAAIGIVTSILDNMAGNDRAKGPDHDNILLAGLLAARTAQENTDGIGDAYKDIEVLRKAGRMATHSNGER